MAKKFRGNDGRMISKAIKLMEAINRRDDKAVNMTKPTTAISTRSEIIPAADATLVTEWDSVYAHLVTQKSLTV